MQGRCPLSFYDDERRLSFLDACFARVKFFPNNVYYCKLLDRYRGYPSVHLLRRPPKENRVCLPRANVRDLDARTLHLRVNRQARIIEKNAGLFDCGSEKPCNHRSAPRFHFTRKSSAETSEARPKVFRKTFRQLIPLNFKPSPDPFRDHCISVFGC
jgi:hypothetical protein